MKVKKQNRLVVGSVAWSDTIPDWLLEAVRVERMICGFAGIIGKGPEEEQEVGDAEACVYLYTRSLEAPMGSEMTTIYLYLATKFMQKRTKNIPDSVKIEKLTEYEKSELSRLKRQLYRARGGHIKHPLLDAMRQLSKKTSN